MHIISHFPPADWPVNHYLGPALAGASPLLRGSANHIPQTLTVILVAVLCCTVYNVIMQLL